MQAVPYIQINAILPQPLLVQIEPLLTSSEYPDLSALIEAALVQILHARMDAQIVTQVAKLNLSQEQSDAEEGIGDYFELVGKAGVF